VSYVLVHEEWYEELPAEVTAELEAQMEWFLEAARSRRCVPVAVIAAEVGYVESSIYRLAREGLVYAEERPAVGGHGSDYQWYVDPVEVRAWVGLSLKVRRAIGEGRTTLAREAGLRVGGWKGSGRASRAWFEEGDGEWMPGGRLPEWVRV